MRRLQTGGYWFGPNDLSVEEWEALGKANELIDDLKANNRDRRNFRHLAEMLGVLRT